MTSLAHVRTAVKRLAEVAQSLDGGREHWSVAGAEFLSITRGRDAICLRLPADDAEQVLLDIPGSSLVTGPDTILGVEIPLGAMNGMQANAVIGRAWAHRAPERLTPEPLTPVSATAQAAVSSDLPASIGRPAMRALHGAGIATLADLSERTEAEMAALHGVGPKAIAELDAALADRGLNWRKAR